MTRDKRHYFCFQPPGLISFTMDILWKELSEHNSDYNDLKLFCETDPASSALYVLKSNHLIGLTYESNFTNDSRYLVEYVLPGNASLKTVDLDWGYLAMLEEDDRRDLMKSIGNIRTLEDLSIGGGIPNDSDVSLTRVTSILLRAHRLKNLSINVAKLRVNSEADLVIFARALSRCTSLESLTLGALFFSSSFQGTLNPLFESLSMLENIRILSIAQAETIEHEAGMVEGVRNVQVCFDAEAIEGLRSLNKMQCLSLFNLGLTDSHCQALENTLSSSTTLQSLVLLDNMQVTERGNEHLLRLVQKNRSLFSTIYGLDIESPCRMNQLRLLHMNRCGRAQMHLGADCEDFLNYVARINEIVPEDLELDALFHAILENPDVLQNKDARRDDDAFLSDSADADDALESLSGEFPEEEPTTEECDQDVDHSADDQECSSDTTSEDARVPPLVCTSSSSLDKSEQAKETLQEKEERLRDWEERLLARERALAEQESKDLMLGGASPVSARCFPDIASLNLSSMFSEAADCK